MVTICTGWVKLHEPVRLKEEDGREPGTSHGMCPECEQDLLKQANERRAFLDYIKNFPHSDPRD